MENIIKSFFGVFLLLVAVAVGMSMVFVSVNAKNADQYLNAAVKSLTDSNFSEEVEQQLIAEAGEKGYVLQTSRRDTDQNGRTDLMKVSLYYSRFPGISPAAKVAGDTDEASSLGERNAAMIVAYAR